MFRPAIAAFIIPICFPAFAQAPSAAEQDALAEKARQVALRYSDLLPDFVCTEIIHRASGDSGQWRSRDTLTMQLAYFQKKETYTPLIHGKPVDMDYEAYGGAISTGEFGSALRWIFEPDSQAAFHWERSASTHGSRVSVYSYRIDRSHSRYGLVFGSGESRLTRMVGFHGVVDIDGDTGAVLHLTTEADDISADFPIREAHQAVDYQYTDVGGRQYLLPARAEMRLLYFPSRSVEKRQIAVARLVEFENEVEFRSYRKFATDATIDFGDGK